MSTRVGAPRPPRAGEMPARTSEKHGLPSSSGPVAGVPQLGSSPTSAPPSKLPWSPATLVPAYRATSTCRA